MSDTAIQNLIMERVVDVMVEEMIDNVADNTRIGLFRTGRLQSDPTVKKLNVLLHEGSKEWPDIIASPREWGMSSPSYEAGGRTSWWRRRFVVEYELFFLGEVNRNSAREKSNVIFSRFKYMIQRLPLNGVRDSFGEGAVQTQVVKMFASEDGGPGTFIWRGEHWFEVLTVQEFA